MAFKSFSELPLGSGFNCGSSNPAVSSVCVSVVCTTAGFLLIIHSLLKRRVLCLQIPYRKTMYLCMFGVIAVISGFSNLNLIISMHIVMFILIKA